jgi:hypothetical protein
MTELSADLARLVTERTGVFPAPSSLERERASIALRRLIAAVVDSECEISDALVQQLEVSVAKLGTEHSGSRFGITEGGAVPEFPMGTHPVIGMANPIAPPMLVDLEGEIVVGRTMYNAAYEGLPGSVYGGFLTAAFDAVLGIRAALEGTPCSAVSLNTRIKAPTPLHTTVTYQATLRAVDDRKLFVEGTLSTAEGEITAEVDGVFLAVNRDKVSTSSSSRSEQRSPVRMSD